MSGQHPMTIGGLIDSAAARLEASGVAFGHGTATAYDEAAWLVLWKLGLPLMIWFFVVSVFLVPLIWRF